MRPTRDADGRRALGGVRRLAEAALKRTQGTGASRSTLCLVDVKDGVGGHFSGDFFMADSPSALPLRAEAEMTFTFDDRQCACFDFVGALRGSLPRSGYTA